VRFVATRNEVWVTEPGDERIEVFSLGTKKMPAPVHAAFISVHGGPESLVIDGTRGRAYTHMWTGTTLAIDLERRTITDRWPNGCGGSRGIALDERRGQLFAACEEGRAVVLDVANGGRALSSLADGAGVDVIAYDPARAHLYVPGADSATMAVMGVSSSGVLVLRGRVETARGAHCVAADDRGNAWVCDPKAGRLLRVIDAWPAGAK
jgi:hypothetical protein